MTPRRVTKFPFYPPLPRQAQGHDRKCLYRVFQNALPAERECRRRCPPLRTTRGKIPNPHGPQAQQLHLPFLILKYSFYSVASNKPKPYPFGSRITVLNETEFRYRAKSRRGRIEPAFGQKQETSSSRVGRRGRAHTADLAYAAGGAISSRISCYSQGRGRISRSLFHAGAGDRSDVTADSTLCL